VIDDDTTSVVMTPLVDDVTGDKSDGSPNVGDVDDVASMLS